MWPDGLPQHVKFAAQTMNASDGVSRMASRHEFFQFVQLFAIAVQHGKVSVHDGVENSVRQKVCLLDSDAAKSLANPSSDSFQTVSLSFLKGDHKVLADDQADLFYIETLFQANHASINKKLMLKVVNVCWLMYVDDIFQGKPVNAEQTQ
jgi:hypothetical protein